MKMQIACAAAVAMVGFSALAAEDYVLPANESDTVSTNVTYATATICGDLTVNGNAQFVSPLVDLNGGTVTADGAKSVFCFGRYNMGDYTATINVSTNETGAYGKIVVKNGTAGGFSDSYNVGARILNLVSNATDVVASDGCVDFLDLRGGGMQAYNIYNYSTLTGRITVTGNNILTKINGYSYGGGMFRKGTFLIDLRPGSTLGFPSGNQQASWNDAGVVVRTTGTGDVTFGQTYNGNSEADNPLYLRKGAYFNHVGEMIFNDTGDYGGVFQLEGNELVGPNVTRLRAATVNRRLRIPQDVCQTVPDVDLSTSGSMIVGDGRIVLDCTRAPHVFKADSPRTYKLKYSKADHVITNNLRIVKTGSFESTVTSAGLVSVWVKEGTMRFTGKDCTICDLRVAEGAEAIADGCTLTLNLSGGAMVRPQITTVNGGKVVYSSDGANRLYGPAMNGPVRVTGGDVSCSAVGCAKKYWRFTARGMYGKPQPFHIRNLFLFSEDHVIQNWGLGYVSPVVTEQTAATTPLAAGKVRWLCNSATNVLATGIANWQDIDDLAQVFKVSNNGNNFANLTAPVVNADDPTSWLTVEMRLADTAKPITGYAITAVIDSGNYCDRWDVYASDDGVEWELVDARDGERLRTLKNGYYTFDGYEYTSMLQSKAQTVIQEKLAETFLLGGYVNGGLSADDPIQLQIDPEASFDLSAYTGAAPTVDALTVDAANGGGKLTGGTLSAAGEIHLLALDYDDQDAIPFEFDGTAGTANLTDWKVFDGSVELPGSVVAYNAEAKQLELQTAFIHITENGEGDLQGRHPGKDLAVLIDSGVSFTNTVAFTGSKAITVTGAGTLVSTVESPDYSGPIFLGGGTLRGVVSNAFGTGTITVEGSKTQACCLHLGSTTVNTAYDNDIVLKSDSSTTYPAIRFVTSNKYLNLALNGSITSFGNLVCADSDSGDSQGFWIVSFNGPVTAIGQTVEYSPDNQVAWKDTVKAGRLLATRGYPRMGTHHLYSSDNEIGRLHFFYIACKAEAANAFGGADIHGVAGNSEDSRGSFDLNGYDQIASCLTWEGAYSDTKNVKNERNAAATLTLTGGVALATTCYRMQAATGSGNKPNGKYLSLTVDAGNDDFVQEFTNSYWATFGTVTVSNGTLRLAGTSSATNVPALLVEGGAFEIDSVRTNALRGVTNLVLGAEARLGVSARTVAPFLENGSKTVLRMTDDSVLDLPAGAAITVRKAYVDGRAVGAGTYTGADGSGADVLPQIRGAGTLTVEHGGGVIILFR